MVSAFMVSGIKYSSAIFASESIQRFHDQGHLVFKLLGQVDKQVPQVWVIGSVDSIH
jgi:hypothetical protein